jgi:alpha-2-macroglobulin
MPLSVRAALALLLIGTPLQSQDTLRVRQVMPGGELRPSSVITITFNQPLAGTLERLRDPATVVRLVPALNARIEWRDPATIRIIPAAPLRPGASLTIAIDTLSAPDGSRLVGGFTRTFTVRAPTMVGSVPHLAVGVRPALSPTGRIMLRMSGAIDTADVARLARLERSSASPCPALTRPLTFRVVVRAPAQTDPYSLQFGDVYNRGDVERRFDQVVELTPVERPPEDCDLDVIVPLVDAGVRSEIRYAVRSAAPFRATASCEVREDCAASKRLILAFTAPVSFADVRRFVRLAANRQLTLPDSGPVSTHWPLPMTASPGDTLRLTIDAMLRDTFGRALTDEQALVVVVGDRRPAWWSTTGLLTLPRTETPSIRVRHVNIDSLRVTVFRSPRDPVLAVTAPWFVFNDGTPIRGDSVRYVIGLNTPLNEERTTEVSIRVPDPSWMQSMLGVRLEVTRTRRRLRHQSFNGVAAVDSIREDRWPNHGLLVQFTDLMTHLRVGAAGGAVFVTNVRTGAAVPGVQVRMRSDMAQVVAEARTDARGVALLPALAAPRGSQRTVTRSGEDATSQQPPSSLRPPVAVDVRLGSDHAFTSVAEASGLYFSGSSLYQRYFFGPVRRRALVFSDRDIYRPGEIAFFNAIVKDGWLDGLRPAVNDRVRWRVLKLDEHGEESVVLLVREATLGSFGTHADSVRFPERARVGNYVIYLERRESGRWTIAGSASIQIAEYRAPEFTVAGSFLARIWSAADTVRARFASRLLFDAPLVGARVSWRAALSELQPWDVSIPGLGRDWHVGRTARWWDQERSAPKIYKNGDGSTDANGVVDIRIPTDSVGFSRGANVQLDVSVSDVNGQSISTRASTTVSGASFYLVSRVDGQEWWWRAGQPQHIRVGAITGAGAWVNGVATRVIVLRQRWEFSDAQGNSAFRAVIDTLQRDSLWTRDSSATFTIVPSFDGALEVVFTALDAQGREASTSVTRWVMGNGTGSWWMNDRQALPVFVSKDSVRTGDTLTVSFSSPFARAQAWITVEREGVLHQERFTVTAGANTLRLPVSSRWIPSVSVGVMLVREGDLTATDSLPERYRAGLQRISVDRSPKRLLVSLRPRNPEYRPGSTATVDVQLEDFRGRPVKGEVVMWATDEGVLSLTGFETPRPIEELYGEWNDALTLATTLSSLRRGLAPLATGGPYGSSAGSGVARLAGSSLSLSAVVATGGAGADSMLSAARSDFRSTAFYQAGIRTDASGRAHVRVRLPDNLTTFRLMAIAVDATDRIGSGDGKIIATKPLLVRASMPRFVRPADTFLAGGVVNTRGRSDSIPVQVIAAGDNTLTLSGNAQQRVSAGPEGALARFNWRAGRGTAARIRLGVSGGALQDAVAITLPVQPDQHSQAHTIVALVRDSATLRFTLPRDIDPVRSRLTIRVGPTPLPVIRAYAAYLDVYPYLCTEQLTSTGRAIVALLELHRVGVAHLADAPALRAKLGRVVDLLIARQRADGAFGYWSSWSWSIPWLDSYVGSFLLDARAQGANVPDDVIRRTSQSLKAEIANRRLTPATRYGTTTERREQLARHFSQLVAAADFLSRADTADVLHRDLVAQAQYMTFEDRARLVNVMARRPERIAAARAMLNTLWESVSVAGNRIEIPDSITATMGFPSRIRLVAWLLRATQLLEPRHPLIGPLAQTIIQRERAEQGGRWNTQDYAFAAEAVAQFMRRDASARSSFALRGAAGTILLAGNAGTEAKEHTVALSGLTLTAGDSVTLPVSVRTKDGPAYVTLTVQELRRERPVSLERRGLVVERWYERVTDGRTVNEVDEGDLVRVRLRITAPSNREFVAVEDPLPAGLEVVDTKLRTTSIDAYLAPDALASERQRTAEAGGDEPSTAAWWYWASWNPWDETETYDDRVVFHARTLGKGSHLYSYVARATTPGRFVRPQAHAEEMYNPALSGRSDGGWLVVRAKPE